MKIIERIFEKQQQNVVKLNDTQMGFMPERGTVDAIIISQQMLEKYMAGRKLYVVLLIWKKFLLVSEER